MFLLSPAKLMVVLVVALVVLGPDKLPKVAKQVGTLWGDFRRFRERLESEVRTAIPDLPSADTITQAVRSPLTFLDSLAGDGDDERAPGPAGVGGAGPVVGDPATPVPAIQSSSTSGGPGTDEPLTDATDSRRHGSGPGGVAHQVRPEQLPGINHSELN
jgi:sec-independent protein translocase protein TatB